MGAYCTKIKSCFGSKNSSDETDGLTSVVQVFVQCCICPQAETQEGSPTMPVSEPVTQQPTSLDDPETLNSYGATTFKQLPVPNYQIEETKF